MPLNLSWREWSRGTWVAIAGIVGLAGGITAYEIFKAKKPEVQQDKKKQDEKDKTPKKISILSEAGLRPAEQKDSKPSCDEAIADLPKETMYLHGETPGPAFVHWISLNEYVKLSIKNAKDTNSPTDLVDAAKVVRDAIDVGYIGDSDGNRVKIDPKHGYVETCLLDMAKGYLGGFKVPVFTVGSKFARVSGPPGKRRFVWGQLLTNRLTRMRGA